MMIRTPFVSRNSRFPSSSFVHILMTYLRENVLRSIRVVFPPALWIYLLKSCEVYNIVCGHYVKQLAFGTFGIPTQGGKSILGPWLLLSVPGSHLGWRCLPPLKPSRFSSAFPVNKCVHSLRIIYDSLFVFVSCSSWFVRIFLPPRVLCLLFLSVLVLALPPFLIVLALPCRNLPPRCSLPPLRCRLFVCFFVDLSCACLVFVWRLLCCLSAPSGPFRR